MEIMTKSGPVRVNKSTPYGKWLIGYIESGAWSGWYTLEQTWKTQKGNKPNGCSWKAWGLICGKVINPLYSQINEFKEQCDLL